MATKTKQSGGAGTRRRQRTNNASPNGNRSAAARKRQAEAFAEQSRKKVDERREKATGAAGWVADRAGDWSLDAQDLRFMELQKFLWNPLIEYWFRMEVSGWEKIPEPPVLLVGIHSGAPFVWDAWTVGIHWWRRFGEERPLHGTAHDALMAAPLIGTYFRKMGVLPAAPDSTASQDPIEVDADPARAKDDDYLEEKYAEVEGSIQRGMQALARLRRLPLFG